MKNIFWRIISCALTICLLAVSLNFLTNLMENKESYIAYQPFYEQEADFDVLFMGTGHVKNDFYPMELWNDYGIVSYNFGGHSQYMATMYWQIENALDYTTPKLIVLDCLWIERNPKFSHLISVHRALDIFPLSATKIKAAMDLLNDPVMLKGIEDGTVDYSKWEKPIGLLWDFSIYHTRWNELTKRDFQAAPTLEKGAEELIIVDAAQDISKIDRSERLEEDTVGIEYLEKIIETCQKRGIDILLIFLPFSANEVHQRSANRVYDIAAEYGVNYINFLDMDIVNFDVDFATDTYLNPSGVRKLADYLAKYIVENYQIPDQRSNAEYSNWFEDYEVYKAKKRGYLQTQDSWDTYLMLLADRSLDAVIEISNPEIWSDNKFVSLVENLGIDMSGVSDMTNYLIIRKGGMQAEAASLDITADTQKNTAMGLLRISHDGSGEYSVYLNDVVCFSPGEGDDGNIRIYVRDSENLNTVGQAAF